MPDRPLVTLCIAMALATFAASFVGAQEAEEAGGGASGNVQAPVPLDTPIIPDDSHKETGDGEPVVMEVSPSISGLTDFQGDEIGLVFRTLARQAKMNVVISEAVKGLVTLRLEDKTPREAIDIVVQAKGLVSDEVNGVLFIKTLEERAWEPFERRLNRTAESVMEPIARFKGVYYRKLIEAGVPENIASETVLKEELSAQELRPMAAGSGTGQTPGGRPFGGRVSSEWLETLSGWVVISGLGLGILTALPTILLHVGFAVAVFMMARRTRLRTQHLFFFGPVFWGLATLVGGVFVAALYWLVNESSLRNQTPAS